MTRPLIAALLVACLSASAASAQTPRKITANLDMALTQPEAENVAAESFFAQLQANTGQIVYLDLTIHPNQDPDAPGYRLHPTDNTGENTLCGPATGTFGTVRNLQTKFTLEFNHPNNYHAPTTVYIGDRLSFPQHHIACRTLDDLSLAYMPLRLLGHFVIAATDIPTATEFTLFPIRP